MADYQVLFLSSTILLATACFAPGEGSYVALTFAVIYFVGAGVVAYIGAGTQAAGKLQECFSTCNPERERDSGQVGEGYSGAYRHWLFCQWVCASCGDKGGTSPKLLCTSDELRQAVASIENTIKRYAP